MVIDFDDLTPVRGSPDLGEQYYEFTCRLCEKRAKNTYCEPFRSRMLERRLCFSCDYWAHFAESNRAIANRMTIINGHVYTPGNRTSGKFRGMAGRRFDIEYIKPSIFAGRRITTFDLWSGSEIPKKYRDAFPDTAKFLGGAEKADAYGIICWNSSDQKSEPYPLPHTLGI